MSLLPLRPSCLLQTILLSDLVWCDSPLQKVITVWCTFFYIRVCQTAIIVSSGLSHPTQKDQIKKCGPSCHFYTEIITEFFSRAGKPSEDVNNCLFLINKKGLKVNSDLYEI
jgi:hypothetical protein